MANFDLSKLTEGKNPQQVMLAETRELKAKWEQTGLLEGLKEREQSQISVLLENQAKQLLDEATATGTSAGSEEWSGVALPLVRRIFGEIAAQEFVSVQPMNLPSGLIFYLDFKYGTAQPGNPDFNGKSLFGGDGSDLGSTNVAENGLYGEGRFGYSINDVSDEAAVADLTFTTGSVSWEDVNFEPDLSASAALGSEADNGLMKITVSNAAIANFDTDGVRAFTVSGSGFDAFYPAHTSINAAKTAVTFFVLKNTAGVPSGVKVQYHKTAANNYTRGDFEATAAQVDANPETDIDIPELDIALKSIPIIAKTRKLKAVWTPELAQDLNAYHSVDAEAELTALLSEYISMEIDLEILDMLYAGATAKTEKWSARVGYEYDSATNLFAQSSGESNAYTKGTWFQTLGNKIQSVSNAIHQKTLRGGANFLVVSPETATIIESIPGYAADTDGDSTNNSFAMGVQKVGALNNRFTVYKNPYALDNVILAGFRGSNFLETGAVYAPYVPLIMTPLVYDPKNFTPRRGVMTRYAKKMVRPEYYGKIYVKDLSSI